MTANRTAIVLKTVDYKDSDKRLTLLTAEGQILSVVAKGIKKPSAKLKFAAQVFAFCEYTIADKNGYYTLAGASQIESLFALTYDTGSFAASSVMVEVALNIADSIQSFQLFIDLLKGFKAILYDNKCALCVATFFIYSMLNLGGYCSLPSWLAELDYGSVPNVNSSDTALKALKYAIEKVEKYLDIILVSKSSL